RLPGALEITGVSARSKHRNRPVDVTSYAWFDENVDAGAGSERNRIVEPSIGCNIHGAVTMPGSGAHTCDLERAGQPEIGLAIGQVN
ncbi:MAG: hypothetical protein AAFR41_09385, partial [Pseudomonadota bacterium]